MRKSRKIVNKLIFFIGLSVLFIGGFSGEGLASNGITISPSTQEVAVRGDGPTDFDIKVKNQTEEVKTLQLSSIDFDGLQASGGLVFGGEKATLLDRNRLAKWLLLPNGSITLAPGESKQVTIRIQNSSKFEIGGHYGAVVFRVVQGGALEGNNVTVTQSAAALVLAVKNGAANYQLSLQPGEKGSSIMLRKPTQFGYGFKSQGNAHVVPRGQLQVVGPFNRLVGTGILNTQSKRILPGAVSSFSVPVQWESATLLPGKYKAVLTYRHDATDKTEQYTEEFWYVGAPFLLAFLAVVAIVVLVTIFLLRRRPKRRPFWLH